MIKFTVSKPDLAAMGELSEGAAIDILAESPSSAQVAHIDAALAYLDRLNNEVGPIALQILSSWTSCKGPVQAHEMYHADSVADSLRRFIRAACEPISKAEASCSADLLRELHLLDATIVAWLRGLQAPDAPWLQQAGRQGARMLLRGYEIVENVIARLKDEKAGVQKPKGLPPPPSDLAVNETPNRSGSAASMDRAVMRLGEDPALEGASIWVRVTRGDHELTYEQLGETDNESRPGPPLKVPFVTKRLVELRGKGVRWAEILSLIEKEFNYRYELSTLKDYFNNRIEHLSRLPIC